MLLHKLNVLMRHLWWDDAQTRRHTPPALLDRLTQRVVASEQRHTGQVRICVEASLPAADIWRLDAGTPLTQLVRERAVAVFSQLRVWDTEQNNGVLIYLLLAEHAIEIVADRGLVPHVSPGQWHDVVSRMAPALAARQYEDGLGEALDATTSLLVRHFGVEARANTPAAPRANELPDAPHLQ